MNLKKLLPLILILISLPAISVAKKGRKYNGPFWHDFDFINTRGKSIVYLPDDYDPKKKYPLVISLHGFGGSAGMQNTLFDFRPFTTTRQFILINPDGMKGVGGLRFWNATDFCCNYGNVDVDDVDYISDLIEGMSDEYSVDLKKVHIFGHSNGGFLAYRLACDIPHKIASLVSFAGVNWNDFSKCKGGEPIPVLHIHGTKDFLIKYPGTGKFPGAEKTVEQWVAHNNCAEQKVTSQTFNDLKPLNMKVPFLKTTEKAWTDCDNGSEVRFWSVKGGDHVISFNQEYLAKLLDHLLKFKKN